MFSKLTLSLLIFFTTQTAQARFLVEPHFNRYTGTFTRGSESGDFKGEALGLNAAYIGEHFIMGLNFEKGAFIFDNNFHSNGHSIWESGGVGTFLGFYFFDKVKIWTGYMNSSAEPRNLKTYRLFGQHASFGVGYRVFDGLMANFEMFTNYYTQSEDDTTGKTSGLSENIKTQGSSFSLSYILIF